MQNSLCTSRDMTIFMSNHHTWKVDIRRLHIHQSCKVSVLESRDMTIFMSNRHTWKVDIRRLHIHQSFKVSVLESRDMTIFMSNHHTWKVDVRRLHKHQNTAICFFLRGGNSAAGTGLVPFLKRMISDDLPKLSSR